MYLRIVFILVASLTAYANLHLAFIVVPAYLIEAGFSEVFAATQNTVFSGAAVVLRFMLTPLVDRRRKLSLILASAALGLAPVLLIWDDTAFTVTLSRIFQGLGLALYPFSANAFLADVSPAQHRGTILGVLRVVIIVALMVGPPLAVWVVGAYDYQTLFVSLACMGLIGLVPLVLLQEPKHDKSGEKQIGLFVQVLKDRRLNPFFFMTLAVGIAYGSLLTFVPILGLELRIENYGLFFTIFAAAGALIGVFAGRLSDIYGRSKIVKPALAIFGLGTLATGLLGTWPFLWISGALTGLGYAAAVTIIVAWIIDRTKKRLRASALSLYENSLDVGITFGVFVFGILSAFLGIGHTFMVTGVVVLLLGGIMSARAARSPGSIDTLRDKE